MSDGNKTIRDIDLACAEAGRRLAALGNRAKDAENTLNKALGVLEEQGVYAMFLYLFAREERCGVDELCQLLGDTCDTDVPRQCGAELKDLESRLQNARRQEKEQGRQQKPQQRGRSGRHQTEAGVSEITRLEEEIQKKKTEFFNKVESLADDLDQLLFAREVLHNALVYARYHAKARASAGERE